MALTMNSGGLRELAAPSAARQPDQAAGPPPFSNSRLRSYASRVEGLLDPKLVLSSSVALTGSGLADPFASSDAGAGFPLGSGAASAQPSPRTGLVPVLASHLSTPPGSSPLTGGEAAQQHHAAVAGHHARFAPSPSVMTAAMGGVAGGGGGGGAHSAGRLSPVMVAGAPPPAPTAAWPPLPAPAGASADELAAALSQIQNLKAEIAGVETVLGYLKGSETATTTMGRKAHKLPSQEQLRARADALAASRTATRLPGPSAAAAAIDHAPHLSPLRSGGSRAAFSSVTSGVGAASPARARSAGEAGIGGGGGGPQGVFETLVSETKLGRTWRVPRGPQPVGRGEAVILESALDEALPPGAITAKYGSGSHVDLSFWSGGDVRRDFEMLEMVQREVARQVSVSCVERGRIIDKLADRHAEIFVAVAAAAKAAAEGQRAATDQLAQVKARAAEQAAEIASLRSELASRGAEAEDLRQQLTEATTAQEHYVWDNEQEVEQLQAQADILAEEVEHLHVRLSEAVAEKDQALSRGLERLEGELEAVTDERDDLAQRIRFLERQLHKLRTEMNSVVDTAVAEVQTDPIEWGPVEEEDVPDDTSDTPSLAEIRARYAAHGYGALTPEERMRLGLPPHPGNEGVKEPKGRKRRRALGHFEGLISSERPGRVRGLPWTINAISAIYYDKLNADTVSDREGNPRQRLAEFAVDWHMTRFGLRNLAELNLLDLIASVRQHYKASVRVRWFGQFTGLVEVGDQVDTTPHVSFYLTVLANLAAPNSLVSLFPDTGAGEEGGTPPVALKAAAMPEATKAIFKYLNEPEASVSFLVRAVDPLTDPVTQLVPLDPLVALFMAEYQKRWERNAAHLRSLFRAADYDDDGYIGYDEFVAIVRQLMPDAGERTFTKMYSDAMRRLPEGQSLVDADTFLNVARAFGWDRWRIDAVPVSTSAAAASRPQSHWAFGGPPQSAGSGGGGMVSRAGSTVSRGGAALPAAFSAGSLSGPSGGASSARSVFRRTESVAGLSDADRALLRVLDGALEGLDPPLEEQVGGLLEKLRGAVAAAQQQAAAAAAAAAALPGLELGPSARELSNAISADNALLVKLEGQYAHFRTVYGERTDPAAAWLAFRLLLTSLAAATSGARTRTSTSRSRPGSAKGTVGWGVPRTAMRLTIPSLPFRAGSGARALTANGPAAAPRLSPPSTAGPGPGSGSAPGTASGPGSGAGLGGGLHRGGSAGGRGEGSGGSLSGGAPSPTALGSPLRPRSANSSRSPDLPVRPMSLAQMLQGPGSMGHHGVASLPSSFTGPTTGGALPGPGYSSSPTPPSLVIPNATSPAPLHRNPLPATTTGRVTSATPPSGTPGSRRGVMFSLEAQPQAAGPAAATSALLAPSPVPPAHPAVSQLAAGAAGPESEASGTSSLTLAVHATESTSPAVTSPEPSSPDLAPSAPRGAAAEVEAVRGMATEEGGFGSPAPAVSEQDDRGAEGVATVEPDVGSEQLVGAADAEGLAGDTQPAVEL